MNYIPTTNSISLTITCCLLRNILVNSGANQASSEIDLSDIRKYDLTTVFKHMYKYATEEMTKSKTNDPITNPTYDQYDVQETSRTLVSPLERRSPTDRSGEDARVLARTEELSKTRSSKIPGFHWLGLSRPVGRLCLLVCRTNWSFEMDNDLFLLGDQLDSIKTL